MEEEEMEESVEQEAIPEQDEEGQQQYESQ
jgi:hypothetical protein